MQIELPIIVCGEIIDHENREKIVIKLENGVEVSLPELTEGDIDKIIKSRLNTNLHKMHFDDITIFFQKVAKFWFAEKNEFRDEAARLASIVTGYPESIVCRDYKMTSELFLDRSQLYDQIDLELGNRWYIDEWVPCLSCLIKAQPRGLVTNVLVGNIPIASTFGMFRSLVVKNNTVCKLPKKDPINALYYAMSFLKVAPENPITKSTSIVYWERDSWQEQRILEASDAVCLWGGEQSINEIKKKIKMGTKILEYGPKRSLCMIDLNNIDPDDRLDDIALRAAHDFSIFNQEGCFTSQELYIASQDELFDKFIKYFAKAMDHFLKVYPKGEIMADNKAHVLLTRSEQQLVGAEVISTENHDWTIIISKDRKRIQSHPLSRTAVVHRIEKLEDAMEAINSYTQTVGIYPWKASEKLRDDITIRGADRIVAIGMANYARVGFPHDGIWTYNQLVRWVNVERDIDFKGKLINASKEELIECTYRLGANIAED